MNVKELTFFTLAFISILPVQGRSGKHRKLKSSPELSASVAATAAPSDAESATCNAYCQYTHIFCNGCDLGPANHILRAAIEHNLGAGSGKRLTMFAVGFHNGGVHNGKEIRNIFEAGWNKPGSLQVKGWEIDDRFFKKATWRLSKQIASGVVELRKRAVGDMPRELPITGYGPGTGVFTYFKSSKGIWTPRGKTNATSLEIEIHQQKIEQVIYTRIDVEGHEVNVIRGMDLEQNRLTFPVFQYELGGTWVDNRHSTNVTQADIAKFLVDLGYELYLMGSPPMLMPISPDAFDACASKETGGCEYENGRYFVQGSTLAVLKMFREKNSWLAKPISRMVSMFHKREQRKFNHRHRA